MKNKNIKLTNLVAAHDEVYLDISAIYSKGFTTLMINHARELKEKGENMLVHRSILNEMNTALEKEKNSSRNDVREKWYQVKALEECGIIRFFGNQNDPRESSQQYFTHISLSKVNKSIVLISNNDDMIHDILLQNSIRSYSGKEINVYKISGNSELIHINSKHNSPSLRSNNEYYQVKDVMNMLKNL